MSGAGGRDGCRALATRPALSVPYVSLDLETTGLDPETDEIIEVAAIRFDASGVLDTYQTLVNPERKLEYRIAMLTHIDPAELDAAPHFGSIARRSSGSSGSTRSSARTPRSTRRSSQRKGVQIFGPTYDTFELAGLLLPDLRQFTLGAIADHLGIDFTNRHRAMADADAAMRVFAALRAAARRVAAGADRRGRAHRVGERVDAAPPVPGDRERERRGRPATPIVRASCTAS